jgi:hypothetical protein
MTRLMHQRFQDQHIERAVNEISFFLGHDAADPAFLGERFRSEHGFA